MHASGDAVTANDEPAAIRPGAGSRVQRWRRVALVVTAVLIVVVVVTFPFALRSTGDQLLGHLETTLYDLTTGAPITAEDAAAAESFFNLSVIDLDPGVESVTLGIFGARPRPATGAALFAIDDTLLVRRGLPPSGTLRLTPTDRVFNQTPQLPIRGQTSLYPFDAWSLRLGLTVDEVTANGAPIPLTPRWCATASPSPCRTSRATS